MEKLFKLKANGTTVRTEILAGLTTFMTMAYIIALNPNLLTNFAVGTPLWNGVFLATCIASAIGTICMAFFANKPFVMAPGMGLNSFFAVVVANIAVINECEYESAFQAALVIILVEGIVFLILTLLKVREKIVEAIPLGVRYGIAPAIGLMLMNVGLGSNVGIYSENGGPFYMMRDFFGALTPSIIKGNMGAGYDAMVLTVVTAFLGVFVMVVLAKKGVKAAVLLGMLFSSVIYWAGSAIFLHVNPFASLATASFVPPFADMVSTTLFKFDFAGFVNIGWFTAITLVITFCMIDMFDTMGTVVGCCVPVGLADEKGKPFHYDGIMISDSVATCTGAMLGTSTVTTFVESGSGIAAGGRTGLTALTTAVIFLLSIFLLPVFASIPGAAASSALLYVGCLMLKGIKNVKIDTVKNAVPAFLTIAMMPLAYSITDGIGFGILSYVIIDLIIYIVDAIKYAANKKKGAEKPVWDLHVVTIIVAVLFLVYFFVPTTF